MVALVCRNNKSTRYAAPLQSLKHQFQLYLQGPWRNLEEVEFATLTWVDWYNNRRLFEPIGNVPPNEKEIEYYQKLQGSAVAA